MSIYTLIDGTSLRRAHERSIYVWDDLLTELVGQSTHEP